MQRLQAPALLVGDSPRPAIGRLSVKMRIIIHNSHIYIVGSLVIALL